MGRNMLCVCAWAQGRIQNGKTSITYFVFSFQKAACEYAHTVPGSATLRYIYLSYSIYRYVGMINISIYLLVVVVLLLLIHGLLLLYCRSSGPCWHDVTRKLVSPSDISSSEYQSDELWEVKTTKPLPPREGAGFWIPICHRVPLYVRQICVYPLYLWNVKYIIVSIWR